MTITPFSLLLQLSCMSRGEAAQYLNVRFDTVQKWVSGRETCPPGALLEMKKLIADQQWCAKNARPKAGEPLKKPIPHELGAEDNWPNLGAWRGYAARVIADAPHGAEIVIKPSPPET